MHWEENPEPDHELYVKCMPPERAAAYAALERDLAARFAGDREACTEGKTAFVEGVLRETGFAG